MTKATHNGTCQACGRVQAVKANGRLAKHGYTVEYGYFNGTCSGSDSLPLEQDTVVNESAIRAIRDWANQQIMFADGNIETVPVTVRDREQRGFKYKEINMNREQFIERELNKYSHQEDVELRTSWISEDFDKKVELVRDNLRRNAEFARKDADNLEALREKTYGNDLIPRQAPEDNEPKREYGFRTLREAYTRAEELKAEGFKCRVNGGGMTGREINITYR